MDYLLQKSCTQAPHRESRETESEIPLGPDPCFSPILNILSTCSQTEQVSSKMLCVSASKAAQKPPVTCAAPGGPPEPGWIATLNLTRPVSILRGKPQVLESEHGRQRVWHSKESLWAQAAGQRTSEAETWHFVFLGPCLATRLPCLRPSSR